MTPPLDIKPKLNEESTQMLSNILLDEWALYIKSRKYQERFIYSGYTEVNEFLKTQCAQLEIIFDLLAENTFHNAKYTNVLLQNIETSKCQMEYKELNLCQNMIRELRDDNKRICKELKESINSCKRNNTLINADLMNRLLTQHEISIWALKRYASTICRVAQRVN